MSKDPLISQWQGAIDLHWGWSWPQGMAVRYTKSNARGFRA